MTHDPRARHCAERAPTRFALADTDDRSLGRLNVCLVDLCYSTRYPNLSVGYLVSAMRASDIGVSVVSPLSVGAKGFARDHTETWRDDVLRRIYFSTAPLFAQRHDSLRAIWHRMVYGRADPKIVSAVRNSLTSRTVDLLMVSTYLDQYPSVKEIGAMAQRIGVPLLVGGAMFNHPDISRAWLDIPGLVAIVGAETDFSIVRIVRDAVARKDLSARPGIFLPDGRCGPKPAPLADISRLPLPDFSDFPWENNEHRVVPIMTGRGCHWEKCLFCSDVTSVSGTSFRSRGLDSVCTELRTIRKRYGADSVVFLDMKLNSDLRVWYGVIERYQGLLPGGMWIGTVHVDRRDDNGLSPATLAMARKSGMRRISCGLETGSQRLANRMAKGADVDRMGRFLEDAKTAGISTRTTMMLGFPGETDKDLELTLRFLEQHANALDRVRIGRFKPIPGTLFDKQLARKPALFPGLSGVNWNFRYGRGSYEYVPARARNYRRMKSRILDVIHQINSRPLPDEARMFNGLM